MNWKLTDNKNWDSLEQQFRWVQDMNFVMQHHLHHEEGSVAVHTRMVLETLQQQPEYRALPAQEQEILWAAALLHDVEKRSTSVDEGGGIITSKGHARRGEYTYSVSYPGEHCCAGALSWFAGLDYGAGESCEEAV